MPDWSPKGLHQVTLTIAVYENAFFLYTLDTTGCSNLILNLKSEEEASHRAWVSLHWATSDLWYKGLLPRAWVMAMWACFFFLLPRTLWIRSNNYFSHYQYNHISETTQIGKSYEFFLIKNSHGCDNRKCPFSSL